MSGSRSSCGPPLPSWVQSWDSRLDFGGGGGGDFSPLLPSASDGSACRQTDSYRRTAPRAGAAGPGGTFPPLAASLPSRKVSYTAGLILRGSGGALLALFTRPQNPVGDSTARRGRVGSGSATHAGPGGAGGAGLGVCRYLRGRAERPPSRGSGVAAFHRGCPGRSHSRCRSVSACRPGAEKRRHLPGRLSRAAGPRSDAGRDALQLWAL